MTFNRMGTIPLPLALHLATYTVIGLFCAFAGGLNLIDPTKIIPNAVIFLGLAGFSWGYVFGILMARKEVIGLGFVASIGYVAAGIWQLGPHWALGALLIAIGGERPVTIALHPPPDCGGLADRVALDRRRGQLDDEFRATQRLRVLQPDPAAHLGDHALTDRQPEPRPLVGAFRRKEGIEDAAAHVGRHARP